MSTDVNHVRLRTYILCYFNTHTLLTGHSPSAYCICYNKQYTAVRTPRDRAVASTYSYRPSRVMLKARTRPPFTVRQSTICINIGSDELEVVVEHSSAVRKFNTLFEIRYLLFQALRLTQSQTAPPNLAGRRRLLFLTMCSDDSKRYMIVDSET